MLESAQVGPLRQVNSQALMQLIIHSGPVTRVELARRSGLSKQTVSAIVGGLQQGGWQQSLHRDPPAFVLKAVQ